MAAYADDFLFIHIPKCGGVSVRNYMKEHKDATILGDADYKPPIGHIPLRDVPRFTGRSLDSFKVIFATIREPYEQQLSQWAFWRDRRARGDRHWLDQAASKHAEMEGFLRDGHCEFMHWYNKLHAGAPVIPHEPSGVDLYWWFLSVNGVVPPNVHIIKMEEMAEQVPRLLGCGAELPHANKGVKLPGETWEYYNVTAAQLLERRFMWTYTEHYAPPPLVKERVT